MDTTMFIGLSHRARIGALLRPRWSGRFGMYLQQGRSVPVAQEESWPIRAPVLLVELLRLHALEALAQGSASETELVPVYKSCTSSTASTETLTQA